VKGASPRLVLGRGWRLVVPNRRLHPTALSVRLARLVGPGLGLWARGFRLGRAAGEPRAVRPQCAKERP